MPPRRRPCHVVPERPGWLNMRGIVRFLQCRRYEVVFPHIRGRLLDIGCGENQLVKSYGNGVGVDVHQWDGVDVVVEDTASLPFDDGSFHTVSFIACLNHIPNRLDVLREARRCLAPGGTLLATMIGPVVSCIWHQVVRPWDEDQSERGMKPGEVWGISRKSMYRPLGDAGFRVTKTPRFVLGLNTLYVCCPVGSGEQAT